MSVDDWHIPDIIVCVILACLWIYISELTPNHQFVPEKDSLSSFPYKNQGMSGAANLAISLSVPVVVEIILYLIQKFGNNVKYLIPFDLIELLCCQIGCVLFSGDICHVLKVYIGRPRPDYYAFMNDHADQMEDDEFIKSHAMKEEFKSFPSGHSCTSASGGLFFTLALIKIIDVNNVPNCNSPALLRYGSKANTFKALAILPPYNLVGNKPTAGFNTSSGV